MQINQVENQTGGDLNPEVSNYTKGSFKGPNRNITHIEQRKDNES